MNWPVVILRGPDLNQTLATVQFDKLGTRTDQLIFVCDSWMDGFAWAKSNGHTQALFIKSGTIIKDWDQWKELVDNYPHKGLIAHLIWHSGSDVYINDQCWFMDVDQFDLDDFICDTVTHPSPIRSKQNLHDDYTPLWIKAGDHTVTHTVTNFGQGLIAKQLQKNRAIVNWGQAARDLKLFLYSNPLDLDIFSDYKHIAEEQLWIFNNESIDVVKKQKLLSPGSGLYWILNIAHPATQEIQIVDISKTQITFCKSLWETWDGTDYGNFVWDFIKKHNLIHYELDEQNMSPLDRLKLKSKSRFVDYVNSKFKSMVDPTFVDVWNQAKRNKVVNFCNDNLITWVLDNDTDKYDSIWCSNILDYKWTLLHTTVEEYNNFQAKVK
jgi:hypothetical protein